MLTMDPSNETAFPNITEKTGVEIVKYVWAGPRYYAMQYTTGKFVVSKTICVPDDTKQTMLVEALYFLNEAKERIEKMQRRRAASPHHSA